MTKYSPVFLATWLALSGCGFMTASDAETNVDTISAELTAEKPFSLSMYRVATVGYDNGQVVTLRGFANRDLEGAFSWVPDDAFGEVELIDARNFEVHLRQGHEINSILSGLPIMVGLHLKGETTTTYQARIVIEPRFTRFVGSSQIWISTDIKPVYVVDAVNPLRYQGRFTSYGAISEPNVTTDDDSDPTISRQTAHSVTFDWAFNQFQWTYDPPTDPVQFSATVNGTRVGKTAGINLEIKSLEMTTEDPYNVWPQTECTEPTRQCLDQLPKGTTDFGSCGNYREVSRCVYGRVCEIVGPQALTLEDIDGSALAGAIENWNAGSQHVGGDSELRSIHALKAPLCANATVEDVIALIQTFDQNQPEVSLGTVVDREGLAKSTFFRGPEGEGLFWSIAAWHGDTEPLAWVSSVETPCHNCHSWIDRVVLYSPKTGYVLILSGTHGWDS